LSIFFTVLLLIILLIDPSYMSGISAELLQPSNEWAVASDTRASCKLLRIENNGRASLDLPAASRDRLRECTRLADL
jgi:hypothetical protein